MNERAPSGSFAYFLASEENKSFLLTRIAGEQGFEPRLLGPKPSVLPLDDSPALRTSYSS